MALPSKSAAAGGARFRQRKISVKQPLVIHKQKDLPDLLSNDLEPLQIHHLNLSNPQQQRDVHAVETGVDKNEEDEVHLQQVINAAQRALRGSEKKKALEQASGASEQREEEEKKPDVYIPTPDASRIWLEASKYYDDFSFVVPDTYIKFSATVEDTVGVEYNLDEEDEEFLIKFNKDKSPTKICTETEFEIICDKFEKTIEEKQPFLSMDPSNILSYKELSAYIIGEVTSSASNSLNNGYNSKYISTTSLKDKLSKELNYKPFVTLFDKRTTDDLVLQPKIRSITKLFDLFGESIYEHWKDRKIKRLGKHIHPSLKFEDPNANEKDNDADPYICFRRREFRQARKTRRADTLGAERIRLLQKSIHRARDLIENVCQREILRLESLEAEHEIFKLRSEGKNLKRAIGIKGDDFLYFPHKRKKVVVKVETAGEEEEANGTPAKKQKKVKADSSKDKKPDSAPANAEAVSSTTAGDLQQESTTSSTQPYVKLPASKIPDMDLVTVSLVLKEKNETIKRAVLEKLRKRKEQDRNFINLTDDPYEPYFSITTNEHSQKVMELNHIPYSSITSSYYQQINKTNYLGEELKRLLEDGDKPLPGVKTFRGSNGELIPSKPFGHVLSLQKDSDSDSASANGGGYIAQLLSNIENNNFNAYNNGYGLQIENVEVEEENKLSEPIFRMRKRTGRCGRMFIDRRGLIDPPAEPFDNDSQGGVVNVYDNVTDTNKRLESRWKFDNDITEYERGVRQPFSLDPSKLNCISDDTQSIRFGSMLLSKSYDLFRESVHQRQQVLIQHSRMRAMREQQQRDQLQRQQQQILQQQQLQRQQQASNAPTPLRVNTQVNSSQNRPQALSSSNQVVQNRGMSQHGQQQQQQRVVNSNINANSIPKPQNQDSSVLLASQPKYKTGSAASVPMPTQSLNPPSGAIAAVGGIKTNSTPSTATPLYNNPPSK